MRNVKKFLALVLAMLMVVSAAATVSAFEDVAEDNLFAEAIADLSVLDIVNGYDETNFGPEDAVTRQQFALMMARAITGVTDDAAWAKGGLVAFEDVTEYQYAIATVVKAGIVDGFLDNTFRPEEGVTFIQALKMAVCALGYGENLEWWQGYYNVALDLGLTDNLDQITDKDQALNRGEVAQLIYNMLYATAANGSTLYADNFEEIVVEEVVDATTYAIVATPKQCATLTTGVTDGGFVGLQQITAGVPSGEILYLAIDEFAEYFDADTVESFFGYTVNVLSVDGVYAGVEVLTDNFVVVEGSAITEADAKFTYNNVIYYPVEEVTGSAIKNEIVVFNAEEHVYVHTAKVLLLDKNGEITDKDGNVILKEVFDSKGNVVYKAFRDKDGALLPATKVMDEAIATATYGTDVESSVNALQFLTAANLKDSDAYQLTLFNDNPETDDIYDRAYYTPVYVGAYIPNKADGTVQMTADANLKKSVTFVADEELAKGDVIVYTYNSQLNTVNVIETLEVETDIVEYVSTLKIKESSNPYFTVTTADDEILTVYLNYNASKVGAYLKDTTTDTVAAPTKMTEITTDAKFDYVDAKALYEELQHSMAIKYIARNDYIIFAEAYSIEEDYDLVVVKEVADLDIGTFYVEAYLDGAPVEIPVTALKVGNKTIDFNEISWIKQSTYIEAFVEGGVYRLVELDNGYLLSEVLVPGTNNTNFGLYDADGGKTAGQKLEILDGIADPAAVTNKADRLRTNKDTVWYFINDADTENVTIKVFSDALVEDGAIVLSSVPTKTTYILADKVGYGTNDATIKQYGVATEVYVFDAPLNDVEGFGINKLVAAQVYIPTTGDSKYEYDTASAFGLDTKEYTEIGYYKYSKIGFDINAGKVVDTIYSAKRLVAADVKKVHTVDANGVIIDDIDAKTVDSLFATAADAEIVVDDTYITFDPGLGNAYELGYDKKITSVVAIEEAKAISAQTGAKAKEKIDAAKTVKYLLNAEDNILVVIWSGTAPADPTALETTGEYGLNALTGHGTTLTKINSETLTGSITFADASKMQRSDWWTTKRDIDVSIVVEKFGYDTTAKQYDYLEFFTITTADVEATAEKGVVTISDVEYTGTSLDVDLDAGNYNIIVTVNDGSNVFKTAIEFTIA